MNQPLHLNAANADDVDVEKAEGEKQQQQQQKQVAKYDSGESKKGYTQEGQRVIREEGERKVWWGQRQGR